jgi:hypothetical protein
MLRKIFEAIMSTFFPKKGHAPYIGGRALPILLKRIEDAKKR